MTQPMFFQRRPEVVQAIQITKDNHNEVRAFVKDSSFPLGDLEYFSGIWVIKDSKGIVGVISDNRMQELYIQKHETL